MEVRTSNPRHLTNYSLEPCFTHHLKPNSFRPNTHRAKIVQRYSFWLVLARCHVRISHRDINWGLRGFSKSLQVISTTVPYITPRPSLYIVQFYPARKIKGVRRTASWNNPQTETERDCLLNSQLISLTTIFLSQPQLDRLTYAMPVTLHVHIY